MLASGNRSSTRTVVVHVGPLPPQAVAGVGSASVGPDAPRAGFIVGRAVGGSVVRSRVTRRLRSIMATHLDEVPHGLGVVVRALPAAAQADSALLSADISAGLRRCLRTVGHDPAPVAGVSQ